jgi:hypothetical protein
VLSMSENNKQPSQSQPLKKFFVREVDASLLGRNSGLSKNARHLHLILRKMADAKTGELRIGTHWWTPAEIDREAEICARTRKKAMRELVTHGLAHWKRERITVTVNERLSGLLRNHSVWGKVHYSVSPIPRPDWVPSTVHTQNPNTGVCSSTDHNMHRRGKPRKQRVPSTVHNENPEKNPSTVHSVHRAPNAPTNTTEEPKDLTPAALPSPLPLSSGINRANGGGDSQDSPPTAPPPSGAIKPEYQKPEDKPPEVLWLVSCLKDILRKELAGWDPTAPIPNLAHVIAIWKRECRNHVVDWKTRNDCFDEAVRSVRAELTPAKPAPAPKPPEPDRTPKPALSQKLVALLRSAGAIGSNTVELAQALYEKPKGSPGEHEYEKRFCLNRSNVVQIIQGLRAKGYKIKTTGTNHTNRRFVLQLD